MVEEENLKDLMLVESDLGDGGELDLDEEYPTPPPPRMKALMTMQNTWKGMILLHPSDEVFWGSCQSNL
jgi:hypothetical protein